MTVTSPLSPGHRTKVREKKTGVGKKSGDSNRNEKEASIVGTLTSAIEKIKQSLIHNTMPPQMKAMMVKLFEPFRQQNDERQGIISDGSQP